MRRKKLFFFVKFVSDCCVSFTSAFFEDNGASKTHQTTGQRGRLADLETKIEGFAGLSRGCCGCH